MGWINFPIFSYTALATWLIGAILLLIPLKKNRKVKDIIASSLIGVGTLTIFLFILSLWILLERPPLRTLGETRLWYSFFLPFVGLITYLRWKYKWFISYSIFLAVLFLLINILKPEIHSKTLMPALQSIWFVPHVIVYILSYALLAMSSVVAFYGIILKYIEGSNFANNIETKSKGKINTKFDLKYLNLADNLVYLGFAFLTMGLIFGAMWAKEAWGNYWTWDPKETWALLTWISYILYMHFRHAHKNKVNIQLWILSISFIVLLICWFGINYLPSAANSVHVYS